MTITIDCIEWSSMEEAHLSLQKNLNFPSWYGKNLDALYDLLTEQPFQITLVNTEQARMQMGDDLDRILLVMRDAGALADREVPAADIKDKKEENKKEVSGGTGSTRKRSRKKKKKFELLK